MSTGAPAHRYSPRDKEIEIEATQKELALNSYSEDLDFGNESKLPPPPTLTVEEENKLWRKIDLRLLPILSLIYLFSFLDRGECWNLAL